MKLNLQYFAEPTPDPNIVLPTQSTPQPAAPTQPQTANVDINAIISQAETKASEAAEKKMTGVFKSMLEQQGFDAEAISKMTADWKAKQVTPEQELKQRDDTIGQLQRQLEDEKQEKIALSKGVPLSSDDEPTKEKVNACLTLAKSYVSDTVTFEQALDKALAIINFEQKQDAKAIPRFDSSGNKDPIANKDTKGLSYMERLKLKNPQLYAEHTKK